MLCCAERGIRVSEMLASLNNHNLGKEDVLAAAGSLLRKRLICIETPFSNSSSG
jgi:hypothetical protein